MKSLTKLCLVVPAAIVLAAGKKPEVVLDPGPPPASLEEFRQESEAAVLQGFFDPTSAQFQWDRGVVGGWFKPVLSAKIPGWWTCGLVNGKNRMGGYVGFRRFVVVMRNGSIVFTSVSDGGDFDFLSMECDQAIKKGILPTAEAQIAAPADSDAPRFGFDVKMVADGAYVASVQPEYPADLAHLVPGMVIAKLNGLALRGFDRATFVKMIASAEGDVVFDIIGRGPVTLHRAVKATADQSASPR